MSRRRRGKAGSNRSRTIFFWLLLLVVVALGGSTLMGRWAERPEEDPRVQDGSIATRVEILNGSGLAGAGSQLASTLRGAGFQIVDVRNADRFDYPKTLVVLRTTDFGAAREVAGELGGAQIIRQRAIVDWDVTVVIGRDRSKRS